MQDASLKARLLATFAHLLHADEIRAMHERGTPLLTLLRLLEESRNTLSLPDTVHQIVEGSIVDVKKAMENGSQEDKTSTPVTPPPNPSMVQPPAPTSVPELQSTAAPLTGDPSSAISWGTVIVLIMTALGLLRLLPKRRS